MAMENLGAKKKKVVVVGGGVGGSLIAKTLQNDADVSLIDSKEYFEITWASLRSMVEPSFAKRSVINHSEYLPNAHVITTSAIDLTDNEVLTAQGHAIAYDYLVIATGHQDNVAFTKDERLQHYQAEHEKIKSANSILIVGGGPTGVELAGEIAVDFPDKKVTLVHRGTRLLEFIGEKAGRKALNWLISKKIEVILGQSVNLDDASNGTYRTSGGETIMADCHFNCTGKPIASTWLQKTILSGSLDGHGRLMVDASLRVKGFENVFGIGDITDVPELKQGYLAQQHALVVAKNLRFLIQGGKQRKMVAKNLRLLIPGGKQGKLAIHKPGPALAIVSLGRRDGVSQILCISMVGRIPGMIKSRDLFVGKTRKQLGLRSNID